MIWISEYCNRSRRLEMGAKSGMSARAKDIGWIVDAHKTKETSKAHPKLRRGSTRDERGFRLLIWMWRVEKPSRTQIFSNQISQIWCHAFPTQTFWQRPRCPS